MRFYPYAPYCHFWNRSTEQKRSLHILQGPLHQIYKVLNILLQIFKYNIWIFIQKLNKKCNMVSDGIKKVLVCKFWLSALMSHSKSINIVSKKINSIWSNICGWMMMLDHVHLHCNFNNKFLGHQQINFRCTEEVMLSLFMPWRHTGGAGE